MTSTRKWFLVVALVLCACGRRGAAGGDATVSGTWTVEGAPPTAASCAEVGIDTVRLGIYAGSGGVEYIEALEAPCTAGRLDTITPVLAAGTYDVAWEGFRGETRVAQGNRYSLVATPGGHAVVPVVDFVSGYDPSGSDASVSARWTIDGVAPSSVSCAALGIARVRVVAFHGTRPIELAPLTATCSAGLVDTRPMAVLASGDVVLQLQALDVHQAVLFSGAMAMLHVAAGPTHVALYDDVPVDFESSGTFDPHGTDATLSFAWTLDHQAASIDVCDAVSAGTAALVLYAADDAARAHGVAVAQAPCHLGAFDSGTTALVRAGAYLASVELRDTSGVPVAGASPSATPFAVTAGARFVVPSVDVAFPTTLAVSLEWASPATGAGASCAGAGVTTMGYSLVERGSGLTVEQRGAVPCATRLVFDAVRTPGFGAGTYDLSVTGSAGSRAWHTPSTECTGIAIAAGAIAWDACFVTTP